jgi:BlaI family transcriptional regulator, penicillinase repressor
VLWQRAPLATEDIVAALADDRDWQPATIKTLLNRLLTKGVLAAERDGRRYLYRPLVRREDYLTQAGRSLLDRLFGGRVAPLVMHLRAQNDLSEQDRAELRQLLRDLEEDDRAAH